MLWVPLARPPDRLRLMSAMCRRANGRSLMWRRTRFAWRRALAALRPCPAAARSGRDLGLSNGSRAVLEKDSGLPSAGLMPHLRRSPIPKVRPSAASSCRSSGHGCSVVALGPGELRAHVQRGQAEIIGASRPGQPQCGPVPCRVQCRRRRERKRPPIRPHAAAGVRCRGSRSRWARRDSLRPGRFPSGR